MSDIADVIGRYASMDAGKIAAFVKHVSAEMGAKLEAGSEYISRP